MSEKEQGQKEKVIGKINEIKKNVETFISDVNVNELKESLNTMVKDAQKDLSKLVDKDLGNLKSKYHKEKMALENKAKKFIEGHKKEIVALQKKFEKMVKEAGKKPATKKAAPAPKKIYQRK